MIDYWTKNAAKNMIIKQFWMIISKARTFSKDYIINSNVSNFKIYS